MDFRDHEADFQGADRRYAELTRQHDAGIINDQEFDAQRQRLMVRDDQGRWWAKLGESGEWHYRDDRNWIRGTPPGYREQVVPEPTNYFEEVDLRYAQLKRRHQAGEITQEEFDEQLKRSMVQDERGRWWSKARKTGEWHYNNGSDWIPGSPPGYQQSISDRKRDRHDVQHAYAPDPSMEASHALGTIHIKRENRLMGWGGSLRVFIDGREVGKLRNGEEGEFSALPGTREVSIKAPRRWVDTPRMNVDVQAGKTTRLVCMVVSGWLTQKIEAYQLAPPSR